MQLCKIMYDKKKCHQYSVFVRGSVTDTMCCVSRECYDSKPVGSSCGMECWADLTLKHSSLNLFKSRPGTVDSFRQADCRWRQGLSVCFSCAGICRNQVFRSVKLFWSPYQQRLFPFQASILASCDHVWLCSLPLPIKRPAEFGCKCVSMQGLEQSRMEDLKHVRSWKYVELVCMSDWVSLLEHVESYCQGWDKHWTSEADQIQAPWVFHAFQTENMHVESLTCTLTPITHTFSQGASLGRDATIPRRFGLLQRGSGDRVDKACGCEGSAQGVEGKQMQGTRLALCSVQ